MADSDNFERIALKLVGADGVPMVTNIRLHHSGEGYHLAVSWPPDAPEREFIERDWYESFRSFRRMLDADGVRVLCQGARPNVYPSGGMGRQSGARKAYALTLGKPTSRQDLVDIFESLDDPAVVGSVAEQDAFVASHWEAFKKNTAAN